MDAYAIANDAFALVFKAAALYRSDDVGAVLPEAVVLGYVCAHAADKYAALAFVARQNGDAVAESTYVELTRRACNAAKRHAAAAGK